MTDVEAEIAMQDSLPTLGVPEFEGVTPVSVLTRFKGGSERIARGIGPGERGVLLVEYDYDDARHPRTKDGVKRVQILKVLDLYELPRKTGRHLLAQVRTAYRHADDERHGRQRLPGIDETARPPGIKVTVDASGTALTEEEVAEIRGMQLDPDLKPVVLVFEDGSRGLWPDDWHGLGQTRGGAGCVMRRPGSEKEGDVGRVVEVLDDATGETLERWTPDDEEVRLAAEEDEALRQEAREDLEATGELERGRGNCGRVVNGGICTMPADKPHPHADDSEPFAGYDAAGVPVIRSFISTLEDADAVLAVAAYEEARKGRKSILETAGRRAAELGAGGEG